jgi:hypothetical protein
MPSEMLWMKEKNGAGGRGRTDTRLREQAFKSAAYFVKLLILLPRDNQGETVIFLQIVCYVYGM